MASLLDGEGGKNKGNKWGLQGLGFQAPNKTATAHRVYFAAWVFGSDIELTSLGFTCIPLTYNLVEVITPGPPACNLVTGKF